jgi:glycosyltransferase involved in cell wall biosynthesis
MPSMVEKFDLSGFDLIISSSHCVAKGIIKPSNAVHISYVHAPMRYIWDRYDEYFGPGQASIPVRLAARVVRSSLQSWDRKVTHPRRVDHLIANSHFIAEQIQQAYQREAQVIHPFAHLERFEQPRTPAPFYLIVSAFAPYKRLDVAIQAFNQMKLPLKIIGSGQNERQLKAIAGPTIEFLGNRSNEEIAQAYSQCRAFIFPGVEDFGITPIEAMAAGAPVIALKKGGVLETVTEETGLFFEPQDFGNSAETFKLYIDSLIEAVQILEQGKVQISESACRLRARHFSKSRFQLELSAAITLAWKAAGKPLSDLKIAPN